MKIEVQLNKKSIQNTIKWLQQQKKVISEKMLPEYIEKAVEWIENEADDLISKSDIGDNVKSYIQSSWLIERISPTHIKLYNISRHAAYVEFGVGIIGQTSKHPNATKAGYEYNVDSGYKFGQGMWRFNIEDKSELDLPEDAIIYDNYTENGVDIITQGTQGVWYLFNAMENFKLRRAKSLWEEIEKKYWG